MSSNDFRHGKLLSVVEQVVPTMEVIPVPSSWFVHVDKMGTVSECKDKKEALTTSQKLGGISIDVKSNRIIHKTGNQTLDQECQKFATEKGYFISSKQDTGTLKDILNLIYQHFDRENDTLLFLTTVMLLITSHYIGSYSQILSGDPIILEYILKSVISSCRFSFRLHANQLCD